MNGLADILDLIDAAIAALDDMGQDGKSVAVVTKAKLRIAIEPFLTADDEGADLMDLAEAEKIDRECNGH